MTRFHSVLAMIATLLVVFAAGPAFGQDDGTMTFGEEEAEDVSDEDDESDDDDGAASSGGDSDEGTMTFGEEEASEGTESGEQAPTVGLVAVPTDAISDSERRQLQKRLAESLQQVPDIEVQTGDAVLQALKKRTVATCVTEPLCLGSIGDDAGVDRIVLASVDKQEAGFSLDVDYFDVENRAFPKYESAEDLRNFNKVLGEIDPAIKQIFEIRRERDDPDYADQNTGAAQTVIAVGCGALSAGALVGGIVFGNQAASIESELNSHQTDEQGVYDDSEFTQNEARNMLDEAQGRAELANISYGLSGAFAIASGVLFLIDSGSDVAEDSRRAGLLERLEISPNFSRNGAGLGARIEF